MSDWKELNKQRLEGLHPVFAARVERFIAFEESKGLPVVIIRGLCSWADQDKLYAQGRTTPGEIVTNAPGGSSQHNYGLAVDLCPDDISKDGLQPDWNVSHPAWKQLLDDAVQFGLAEGAKWKKFQDNPHFYPVEIPSTTQVLREQYAKGGIAQVWKWFDSLVSPREVAQTV